jgi:purine-cytosine permease-like protein
MLNTMIFAFLTLGWFYISAHISVKFSIYLSTRFNEYIYLFIPSLLFFILMYFGCSFLTELRLFYLRP